MESLNTLYLVEVVMGTAIYLAVGFCITRFWYSPELDEIDEKIRRNGSLEEIGVIRMAFWCSMMFTLWPLLAPYEMKTNFKHWYPNFM